DDYATLRQFRGNSSLATYLTVISRRICVSELARRATAREVQPPVTEPADEAPEVGGAGLERLEEVERLLSKLPGREREVVRLHYIEGRTYEEISMELNIPVNTIGPILSRARKKLRQDARGVPPTAAVRQAKPAPKERRVEQVARTVSSSRGEEAVRAACPTARRSPPLDRFRGGRLADAGGRRDQALGKVVRIVLRQVGATEQARGDLRLQGVDL